MPHFYGPGSQAIIITRCANGYYVEMPLPMMGEYVNPWDKPMLNPADLKQVVKAFRSVGGDEVMDRIRDKQEEEEEREKENENVYPESIKTHKLSNLFVFTSFSDVLTFLSDKVED